MIDIKIDSSILQESQLSVTDLFYLLFMYYNERQLVKSDLENLISKGYIDNKEGRILNKGNALVVKILSNLDSIKNKSSLAISLKEVYPKGKKNGTSYYWTEGERLIEKRLRLFEKKYGKYEDKDIIEATKIYVESFRGDDKYMKLLKYFIFKEEVKDGMMESTSDLYTLLEKIKEGENVDNIFFSSNWTDELI